jgi:hypothetical protein
MRKSELQKFIRENIIETLSPEQQEKEVDEVNVKVKAKDYDSTQFGDDDNVEIIGEDDEDDDAKAIKAAKGARGKFKKLDLAVKALKNIETEMKSLARKYGSADETEKENIKDILRVKTPQKKELESLVAKLEKDVV